MYKEDWQELADGIQKQLDADERNIEINKVMRDEALHMIDMSIPKPVMTDKEAKAKAEAIKQLTG